ncbi:hypothetical protein DL98DRAFT_537112 [Cadophora sp. DSE1049]|nr:hypothetical protein DL98DRAFT_537112 [Cadophora sp. DSE1049]
MSRSSKTELANVSPTNTLMFYFVTSFTTPHYIVNVIAAMAHPIPWFYKSHLKDLWAQWVKKVNDVGRAVTDADATASAAAISLFKDAALDQYPDQKYLRRWYAESWFWRKYMDDPNLEKFPWTKPMPLTTAQIAKLATQGNIASATSTGTSTTPAATSSNTKTGNSNPTVPATKSQRGVQVAAASKQMQEAKDIDKETMMAIQTATKRPRDTEVEHGGCQKATNMDHKVKIETDQSANPSLKDGVPGNKRRKLEQESLQSSKPQSVEKTAAQDSTEGRHPEAKTSSNSSVETAQTSQNGGCSQVPHLNGDVALRVEEAAPRNGDAADFGMLGEIPELIADEASIEAVSDQGSRNGEPAGQSRGNLGWIMRLLGIQD